MAFKKTDMEFHRGQYYALVEKARTALDEGLYMEALELAVASWEHIDGMMQYERKYEGAAFETVEGIEIVLAHAPLLFDFQALSRLELLLKSQRRIDKHASDDLAAKLAEARAVMWEAHQLWNHLMQVSHEPARRDPAEAIDANQRWKAIVESWEQMEIAWTVTTRNCIRPALRTQMDGLTFGKCPSCAAVVKARKIRLLEAGQCPQCSKSVAFVLLPDAPVTT
jgi:hypothetical protein